MDILVKDFIEQVEAEGYTQANFDTTLATLTKDPEKAIKPVVKTLTDAVKADQLAGVALTVTDADIVIRLETSVINLPLQYVNAMKKMLSDDETLAVNVYSVIESPDVNASSLRIDKVASVADFDAHNADMAGAVGDWIADQLAQIEANQKAAAEADAQTDKKADDSDEEAID